jgi:IclR family transcriptional regulator, acetate operon repressor
VVITRLDLVGYIPTTLTTVPTLLAAVLEVVERGYAADDSEREPGPLPGRSHP